MIKPRVRSCSVRRYYDPQTGQFLSLDPAVDQTDQPYAYAENDPVTNVDPYGLAVGIDIGVGAAIGTLVGGVVADGTYLYGAAQGQYEFSWSGLGAATVSGAVGGLVTGACVGGTWIEWGVCGSFGGAAATAVGNLIRGNPLTCHLVVGTVAGAVGGALGGYMFPLRGFRPYKYSNIYRPGLNSLRLYGQAYTSATVGASAGASP